MASSSCSSSCTDVDGMKLVLSEQRNELMSAQTLESDLNFAFKLQMQEAIDASLAFEASSSSSPALQPEPIQDDDDDEGLHFTTLMAEEVERLEQECRDREMSEAEMRKMRDDLNRHIHDQKLASDILSIPADEWEKYGDNFERPYGEGSSTTPPVIADQSFRVYIKGLVSEEWVGDSSVTVSAIGVAICDPKDYLIFELRKPLVDSDGTMSSMSSVEVGIEALLEGLNAAIALDLKSVVCFVDDYMVHEYVSL